MRRNCYGEKYSSPLESANESVMRVLFLTFYYPPDLCAGSFRAQSLVDALQEVGRQKLEVDVMTTMPNRYHSHQQTAPALEDQGPIRIRRFNLPAHQSGMMDQARAFLAYARAVQTEVRRKRWDIVVATSSRLMTAALGARIARQVGAELYLDIRDLFTDTMANILRKSALKVLIPGFRILERTTLRRASRINLVSPGFLEHVSAVAPHQSFRLFTNGIDEAFLRREFSRTTSSTGKPLLIVYAGNIGEGQGLHTLFPRAAQALEGRAIFRLIGDGGRRKRLEEVLAGAGVHNVELLDPVPRADLMRHYDEADLLFTHLNDYEAFHKVIPSKFFEYAATGKRILAGVAGVPAEFLRNEVEGAAVFAPLDVRGMVNAIEVLAGQPEWFDRAGFREKYSRRNIMRAMAADILATAPVS